MSVPFTVVTPTPIDDFNFVSSTVPEDDFPIYDNATTYNTGDRVIVTTGYHWIYESLTDNNLGNFPPDDPLNWLVVSPTNRWAMFDQSGGTITTGDAPLEVVLTGNRINSIDLLEVTGVNVRIQASSLLDGTYYDQTYTLEDRATVTSWFEYFFAPIDRQREVIVTDIPPVGESTYTITIDNNGAGGFVKVGTLLFGQSTEFGFTEYGARASIIDYSRKEVDQFGRASLVRRNFAKRMDVTIWIERGVTDAVGRQLADLRATPALWIAASGSYELLTIFGFYRNFSVDIAYPTQSLCSLEIEGLA